MLRHFTLIAVLATAAALAQATEAGKVIYVAGAVSVAEQAAALGTPVQEGDMLTTGTDGYLYVKTLDNGLFILRPNTKARIAIYHVDAKDPANTRIKLELISGVARSRSGEAVKLARQNFRFNTPVAAIGVRGTDFTVFTDQNTSRVAVISGAINVSGFAGACRPEGFGPCGGAASRELSATQKGQLLQIQRGQQAPQMLSSGVLTPDQVAPPRVDEPVSKAGGADTNLDAKKSDILKQVGAQGVLPPTTPTTPTSPPIPAAPPIVDVPAAPVVVPPPIVVVPPVVVPDPPVVVPVVPVVPGREVTWGRWQTVADLTPTSSLSKDGAERLATNDYFALFRAKTGADLVIPERGSAGFALNHSEAYVRDQATAAVSAATVQNGQLSVDFGAKTFSTSFDLITAQAERFKMVSEGAVGKDGQLYGNNALYAPTNMNVNGVLGPNNDATYLFQGKIDGGRVASGVTYWK